MVFSFFWATVLYSELKVYKRLARERRPYGNPLAVRHPRSHVGNPCDVITQPDTPPSQTPGNSDVIRSGQRSCFDRRNILPKTTYKAAFTNWKFTGKNRANAPIFKLWEHFLTCVWIYALWRADPRPISPKKCLQMIDYFFVGKRRST
jgi:hypothetical protein